jgi:hypothetical protein
MNKREGESKAHKDLPKKWLFFLILW